MKLGRIEGSVQKWGRSLSVAALLLAVGCAERQTVAGASPVSDKSRRFVRDASEVAFIERGSRLAAGALPSIVVLGKAGNGPAAVLLRFELPRDVEVQHAYLLIERADDDVSEGSGVGLHAERIIGPWDAKKATWVYGPELRDAHAPSLTVRHGAPRLLRIDITPLLTAHEGEPPDQGIALVADRVSPSGVAIAVAPDMTSPLPGDPADPHMGEDSRLRAPRIDLYVK